MRAVIQRVSRADVKVEDKVTGSIEAGLLVYLGIHQSDGPELVPVLADKIINLRIFPNEEGRFDRSVLDIGGSLLIVSQFTLYGDCRKGRRPNFQDAAPPEKARALYEQFLDCAAGKGIRVAAGVFQAHMDVSSVNDGPVTIIMDVPN
ncbi:D-aminoacyl-tRNA deacylase [Oligoflexus tunisiensis]|uniref:D-aminoacyl-tRNA deacylase n=1 Tax=Oligoflexus tunisiensis TaxID=708132 RepID=UPI000ADE0FF6|nr:D-aminoacyl-tRNA deacylase [Oligoflexus tunisiensis]